MTRLERETTPRYSMERQRIADSEAERFRYLWRMAERRQRQTKKYRDMFALAICGVLFYVLVSVVIGWLDR